MGEEEPNSETKYCQRCQSSEHESITSRSTCFLRS